MANPSRFKPEQQLPSSLTLAGTENSDDMLRSEVFTPQDRRAMSVKQLPDKLDELQNNLSNASELARTGQMEAATRAYTAAIRTAESVDQVAVARERREIKQALQEKNLDPFERRQLLQKDADLHTLERAPGFALANYALVLIRMGDQFNGTKLLVRAQERDREMMDDPNFKRHLKQAIEESAQAHKPTAQELPPTFPIRTMPVDLPANLYPPRQPPQELGYRGAADTQPIQYVQPPMQRTDAPVPPKSETAQGPKFSPLDAQNHTPIEATATLYARVVNEKTMSPAVQQQFMQAIKDADAGISPRLQPFMQKQAESRRAIENFAAANPTVISATEAIDNSAVAMIVRMQPQQRDTAAKLYYQLDRVGTSQERANLQAQLVALDPSFKQLLQQRDQAMGPALPQLLMNNAQVQTAIEKQFQSKDNQAEFNQAAVTRFTFALALEKAGNPEAAKTYMAQALSMNNSQDAGQNEFWRRTAARLGIQTADSTSPVAQNPNPGDAGQAGTKPLSAAAEQLISTLKQFKDATDAGGNPATVFNQLKPGFEQTIAKADAEFETTMKKIPQAEKDKPSDATVELISGALAGRFLTRAYMAMCADKAGDGATAATKLTEALATLPAAYQKQYLQQKEVHDLAVKIGLREDQLPIKPDAILTRNDPPTEKAREKAATIPGVSDENQGLRPDQVLAQAKQMLRTEGMTPATKKQFEESIKIADSLSNQKDLKDAEKLVQWLKTGKKDNGQDVSHNERAEIHQLINNTFAKAIIGIQFRAQYAQLLTESKQYDSAQTMHRERIKLSDELPLQLFRSEMQELSKDMTNVNLSRMVKADLGSMFEQIGGSGSSKEDGLLYMPISSRKQAAYFYISGRESNNGTGLFKPDQAIDMINETRAAELRLYGIDLTKNPNFDSHLRQMAAQIEPFASEKLRQDKGRFDTYWSNGFIDAGVGAVALTGAAFLASLATKNPKYFGWALTGDKALTGVAKVGLGTTAFLGAGVGRHYLHQSVTGQDESWGTSFVHSTAGIAGIGGIYATRGLVNKVLFRGATEEGAILRATETFGTAAEGVAGGQKVLTVEQLGKFYELNNIRVPAKAAEFIAKAENKALVVAKGTEINQEVFQLCALGLNPAQAVNLAKTMAPLAPAAEVGLEGAAATTPFLARVGEKSLGGLKNVVMPFGKLDLATASSGQLGMRTFYGNWAQATGGLTALESVRSLDRDTNLKTGEKYSYAESLWKANYESLEDNTLTRGLLLGTFAMKGGALPKNYYAKDASLLGKAWGVTKAPFTASRFGATTANSSYFQHGLQAGYLGFASTMYDLNALKRGYLGYTESSALGKMLDMNQKPIENLAPPGVKPTEIPQLAPGAGAPVAPVRPTDAGEPLKDEAPPKPPHPLDGTPGL